MAWCAGASRRWARRWTRRRAPARERARCTTRRATDVHQAAGARAQRARLCAGGHGAQRRLLAAPALVPERVRHGRVAAGARARPPPAQAARARAAPRAAGAGREARTAAAAAAYHVTLAARLAALARFAARFTPGPGS